MIGIDLTYTKGWRRGSSPQRVPRARRSSRPGWPSRWLGSCTRRSRPPKLPQGSLPARSSARRPKPETIPNQGSRALLVKQTGFGSFLASSKPIFECKYSLVTRCYAKQHEIVLRCMSPCSVCTADFFQLKMLRIASQWKYVKILIFSIENIKDFFPLKILRISSHWKY